MGTRFEQEMQKRMIQQVIDEKRKRVNSDNVFAAIGLMMAFALIIGIILGIAVCKFLM